MIPAFLPVFLRRLQNQAHLNGILNVAVLLTLHQANGPMHAHDLSVAICGNEDDLKSIITNLNRLEANGYVSGTNNAAWRYRDGIGRRVLHELTPKGRARIEKCLAEATATPA